MRSSIVFGSLVGLALVVGCSGTLTQYKTPNNVQCGAGSCSVPKPVNPANIDFEIGESDDHEVMIPTEKIVKRCADDQVWANGMFCSKPNHDLPAYNQTGQSDPACLRWKEPGCDHGGVKPSCLFARCLEYKQEATICLNTPIYKSVCIDKFEYVEPGKTIPASDYIADPYTGKKVALDYFEAQKVCAFNSKHLCKESDWTFGCQGPLSYPYSTGMVRPVGICNIDIERNLIGQDGKLINYAKPASELQSCASRSFDGLVAMNGNLDEITEGDMTPPPSHSNELGGHKNRLKGGHWMPIRARCMPTTSKHNDYFHMISLGFRCCSDAK